MSALSIPPADSLAGPRPRAAGIGPEELADLVRSFTLVTERLQTTHAALQNQVGCLQQELAEAKERLRRSRELAALGEMAAGIAHEIRNPLGSIALDVETLRDETAGRPELSGVCERVLRGVERLDRIVGDVLRFARDVAPQVEEASPAEVIEAAVCACEGLAKRLGVVVEVASAVESIAHFDRHLVVQALTNLLRNAVEAAADAPAPRRVVRVDVRRARRTSAEGRRIEQVLFRVEDGGSGVSAECAERIFHPFFTTRAEGTGLGLAIVHRIADAHGGAVTVRNRVEGEEVLGASFELALPVRADQRGGRRRVAGSGLEAAVQRRIGRMPGGCGDAAVIRGQNPIGM